MCRPFAGKTQTLIGCLPSTGKPKSAFGVLQVSLSPFAPQRFQVLHVCSKSKCPLRGYSVGCPHTWKRQVGSFNRGHMFLKRFQVPLHVQPSRHLESFPGLLDDHRAPVHHGRHGGQALGARVFAGLLRPPYQPGRPAMVRRSGRGATAAVSQGDYRHPMHNNRAILFCAGTLRVQVPAAKRSKIKSVICVFSRRPR